MWNTDFTGVNAGGGRERTISGQSTNSNTSHASVPSKGKPHAGQLSQAHFYVT